MPTKGCSCIISGHCVHCSCVGASRRCYNCTPGQHDRWKKSVLPGSLPAVGSQQDAATSVRQRASFPTSLPHSVSSPSSSSSKMTVSSIPRDSVHLDLSKQLLSANLAADGGFIIFVSAVLFCSMSSCTLQVCCNQPYNSTWARFSFRDTAVTLFRLVMKAVKPVAIDSSDPSSCCLPRQLRPPALQLRYHVLSLSFAFGLQEDDQKHMLRLENLNIKDPKRSFSSSARSTSFLCSTRT